MQQFLVFLLAVVAMTANAVDLKTYRDNNSEVSIGFPVDWLVDTAPKKRDTIFVATTKTPVFATCNVRVKPVPRLTAMSVAEIDADLKKSWTLRDWNTFFSDRYADSLTVDTSKAVRVDNRPGQYGILSNTHEHLGNKTYWQAMNLIAAAPGVMWHVMCGVPSDNAVKTAALFGAMEESFNTIMNSVRLAR